MRVDRTCLVCGTQFKAHECDIRKGRGKLCSQKCKFAFLQPPLEVRFWNAVDKSGECWLWTANKDKDGYGKIYANRKHVRAHRVSWELHVGPIPSGLQVLHNCPSGDNPSCVNPAHLFLGTGLTNMRDKVAKGRCPRGETSGKAKLTNADVIAIRSAFDAGERNVSAIARRFNIHYSTAGDIIRREIWKHV